MKQLLKALFTLGLSVSALLPVDAAAKVERVEPGFWWAGMQEPTLQLMVYGQNIQQANVSVKHKGVVLMGVEKVASPNYLFVNLQLSPEVSAGEFELVFDRPNQESERYRYRLLPRREGSALRQGFGKQDTIYLITPDRFVNADPSNDSISSLLEKPDRQDPNGRHGGDIAGMAQALPYLQTLGVTQIWPQPLVENNAPKYSYHGYGATDLYNIDPRFGSNDSYRAFVAKAKEHGIGVIQDIVVNHIGSNHWWLADLPDPTWLNNSQGQSFIATNHARTTVQDPYASKVDKEAFVSGWFVDTMPDLNQQHPLLATYLIQNSIWWVEFADLSGIREDTYSYADKDFLTQWSKRVMQEYPNFNIVGEEWSANPQVVSYWQRGKKNHDGYVSHTPSMMDFPLYYALVAALTEPEAWDQGFIKLYEALGNDVLYPDPTGLVLFEGNHDTARLFSLLDHDRALYQMAMVYLFTSPRIPQLYYGTEILMQSPKQRDDGVVRSDFPGGWPNDTVNAFTGKVLSQAQLEAQRLVSRLANFRKTHNVVQSGQMRHFSPVEGVYVYARYNEAEQVWVVFNKNAHAKTLDLSRFKELLPQSAQAKELLTDESIELQKTLDVPARGSLVLHIPSIR